MSTVLAALALAGVIGCGLGWRRSAARVRALESRLDALEQELRDDVVPTLDLTRLESEEAAEAARLAKHAVGIEEPLPRIAGEPVTGPVVRALAFGAGARRAVARFGAGVVPLARTRHTARRTTQWTLRRVRAVNVASRVRPARPAVAAGSVPARAITVRSRRRTR